MYKIRSANHSAIDKSMQSVSLGELIETMSTAQNSLLDFQSALNDLLIMARCGSTQARNDFRLLLAQSLASLGEASYGKVPLFNGHLDVDVVFSGEGTEIVRVRIADLIGKFARYFSNFADIASCDVTAFVRRMRVSSGALTCPEASIQGVRLNTFMPRSVKSSRLVAINSLSGLTGLHAMSYGNAIVANADSRETGMPLADGCVSVNGVAIPPSDGSVDNLVEMINGCRERHGVTADGVSGQPLALVNFSGERIEIKISNHCGALLSGFPSGVTEVSANTNGLVTWVSFRRLHEVRFDSCNSVRLASGTDAESVVLKPGVTAELSVVSLSDRRLALSVLQVMANIVSRELNGLASTIERLRSLLDDAKISKTKQASAARKNSLTGKGLASN